MINYRIFKYKIDGVNNIISPFWKTEFYPLAFVINGDYYKFLAVTLQSIKENWKARFEIIVLVDKISLDDILVLTKNFKKNFYFTFIEIIDEEQLTKFQKWTAFSGWSNAVLYKLFLFDPIFERYKRILYLDTDLVVLKNLSELWRINMSGKTLAGINDLNILNIEVCKRMLADFKFCPFQFRKKLIDKKIYEFNILIYVTEILGINPENYINGGVFLINLEVKNNNFWKTKNWLDWCIFLEQDMVNVFFKDNILILDPNYNYTIGDIDDYKSNSDLISCVYSEKQRYKLFLKKEDIKIFHFNITGTRPEKPWNMDKDFVKKYKNEVYLYWFELAERCEYYNKKFFPSLFIENGFVEKEGQKIPKIPEFIEVEQELEDKKMKKSKTFLIFMYLLSFKWVIGFFKIIKKSLYILYKQTN